MEKSSNVWMDEGELSSWREQRGLGAPGAKDAPKIAAAPKRMTVSRLNLMLLEAAGSGNLEMARQALADGALPNARARANPGDTAFTLAIEAGHDALALELLRAGSWPAPSRWSVAPSNDFDLAAAAGTFTDQAREPLAQKAMQLCSAHAKDFGVFKSMRDWCAPNLPDSRLVGMAMAQDRYDLAMKGVRLGVEMSSDAWRHAEGRMQWRYSGVKDHAHRKDVLDLLATPSAVATMTLVMCESFYRCVVLGDDAELALALLDAGLRPNKKWEIAIKYSYKNQDSDPKLPLLALAAGLDRPGLFELFKACPPVMESARGEAISPEKLLSISIGRLMELRELGVDIEGRDAQGRGLPHLWAHYDSEPRDGWATLAKKAPSLFEMKNGQGRTGADLMAAKLVGGTKDEFLASLSRIETREIKKELGAKPKKVVAPVRVRL